MYVLSNLLVWQEPAGTTIVIRCWHTISLPGIMIFHQFNKAHLFISCDDDGNDETYLANANVGIIQLATIYGVSIQTFKNVSTCFYKASPS